MKAVVLLVASFLILVVLALASPAPAQGPVLCYCYCGLTTFPPCSEEACKTVCGYGGGEGGGGRGGGAAQIWYCRALAPDGSWGWAYDPNEGRARRLALSGCQKHAEGCVIEACRINDPSLAQAPSSPRPPAPGQGQTTPQQGWCDLCTRKLHNDVDSGWASGLVRIYVGQAIAGYENCKRRAGGVCAAGDQMVDRLRACGDKMFNEYRMCLSRAIELAADRQ